MPIGGTGHMPLEFGKIQLSTKKQLFIIVECIKFIYFSNYFYFAILIYEIWEKNYGEQY